MMFPLAAAAEPDGLPGGAASPRTPRTPRTPCGVAVSTVPAVAFGAGAILTLATGPAFVRRLASSAGMLAVAPSDDAGQQQGIGSLLKGGEAGLLPVGTMAAGFVGGALCTLGGQSLLARRRRLRRQRQVVVTPLSDEACCPDSPTKASRCRTPRARGRRLPRAATLAHISSAPLNRLPTSGSEPTSPSTPMKRTVRSMLRNSKQSPKHATRMRSVKSMPACTLSAVVKFEEQEQRRRPAALSISDFVEEAFAAAKPRTAPLIPIPLSGTVCGSQADDLTSPVATALSGSTSSPTSPCSPIRSTPSARCQHAVDLGLMFDTLDHSSRGSIGRQSMVQVVARLNNDYNLGMSADDAKRLYAFLGGSKSESITRERFVTGLRQLVSVFANGRMSVSVQQLKLVVSAAFDAYDTDGDGVISADEFAAAACKLGVELSASDAECLHRFFTGEGSGGIHQGTLIDSKPMWEKWSTATQGVMEQILEKTGWNGAGRFLATVHQALDGPGTFQDKFQRAQAAACSNTEILAEAAEFLGNSLGIFSGFKYLETLASEAQCCDSITDLQLDGLPPLLLFLGLSVVSLAKEFDGLVLKEMTGEEALLFAQVFYPLGFSQAAFQKLISCQGCQWRTVEEGDVLNDAADQSLKIIVRGRAEVLNPVGRPGKGVKLRPGTTIGETQFLRGKDLWSKERVIASEPLLLLSWEPEALRELLSHEPKIESKMDRLLAAGMADNMCAVAALQARRRSDEARADCVGSASSDHAVEVERQLRRAAICELWSRAGHGQHGIGLEDLKLAMRHMDSSFQLGAAEGDIERLFSYLDVNGDGRMSCVEFEERMTALHDCMDNLGGFTLFELMSALHRASDVIDENHDGLISLEELRACASRLELPLQEEHLNTLHSYLDSNKDGFIDTAEWAGSENVHWLSALHIAVSAQAQQRGIPRLLFFGQRLGEAIAAPTPIEEKVGKMMKVLWEGVDDLSDFFGATIDLAGVGAALYGIVQELEGVATWDDVDPADLAPFVVFLGLSSYRYFQHLAEGQISDLKEHEAMLYAKVFEDDFTVSEFQKMLAIGGARWEKVPAGSVIGGQGTEGKDDRPVLRMIARGTCEVQEGKLGTRTRVGIGGFLGESILLEQEEVAHRVARASKSCLLLTWDIEELKTGLRMEPTLDMKLRRMATRSVADRLLAMTGQHSQVVLATN